MVVKHWATYQSLHKRENCVRSSDVESSTELGTKIKPALRRNKDYVKSISLPTEDCSGEQSHANSESDQESASNQAGIACLIVNVCVHWMSA